MNKYLITVRIKGQLVRTTVEADSTIHAKLLGEWHYGLGNVASMPTKLEETQTTTPEQQRVKQIKQQLDTARLQQKRTKLNQQQTKLNQQRANLNKPNK